MSLHHHNQAKPLRKAMADKLVMAVHKIIDSFLEMLTDVAGLISVIIGIWIFEHVFHILFGDHPPAFFEGLADIRAKWMFDALHVGAITGLIIRSAYIFFKGVFR